MRNPRKNKLKVSNVCAIMLAMFVYCIINSAAFRMYCPLCTVHYVLCTMHCPLCTVHCALCRLQCTVCSVRCVWTVPVRSVYRGQSINAIFQADRAWIRDMFWIEKCCVRLLLRFHVYYWGFLGKSWIYNFSFDLDIERFFLIEKTQFKKPGKRVFYSPAPWAFRLKYCQWE